MEHWGTRLKVLRIERGFSLQGDYATAVGIDRATISKMVAGNYYNPRRTTARRKHRLRLQHCHWQRASEP